MSLSFGTGPFAPGRAGRAVPPLPDGDIAYVEPHPRRIQAVVGGQVVLDTERALIVHRPERTLTYLFRVEEVGTLPSEPDPIAPGYVSVPWEAVDTWFEEGRQLVHYPPNPYHRVDCRPTRRCLQVTVAGTSLVDTDDTVIVFETSLRPALYVDPSLVRTDLLRPSETRTWCNYKGWASYWDAVIDGRVVTDVAWSHLDPLPESTPIAGLLSFEPTKAEVHAELPQGAVLGTDER